MKESAFNCVYTSGLTINDPGLLTTLATFFDSVALPYPYDLDPDGKRLISWPFDDLYDLEAEQRYYRAWTDSTKELFDARALKVLPLPAELKEDEPENLADQLLAVLGSQLGFFTSSQVFSGQLAVAMHAMYSQTVDPEFIFLPHGDARAEQLRTESMLEYRLPYLGALQPRRILELREETATHRKDLADSLNQMLDDVESRFQEIEDDDPDATRQPVKIRTAPELDEVFERTANTTALALSVYVKRWNISNYPGLASDPEGMVKYLGDSSIQKAASKHLAYQLVGAIE